MFEVSAPNLLDVKVGRRYKRFGMGGLPVYSVIVNGISTCTTTQKEFVVYTKESYGIMQHMPYDEFIKQTYLSSESSILVNSFSLIDRIKINDTFISEDGIHLQVVFTDNDNDAISIQPIHRFLFTAVVTKSQLWNRTFNVEKYIKKRFEEQSMSDYHLDILPINTN